MHNFKLVHNLAPIHLSSFLFYCFSLHTRQSNSLSCYLRNRFFFLLVARGACDDISSPTRDGKCAPCSGSAEAQLLNRQASHRNCFLKSLLNLFSENPEEFGRYPQLRAWKVVQERGESNRNTIRGTL